MIITERDCMSAIVQRVPEFRDQWQVHLADWEAKSPGLCTDVGAFMDFVSALIEQEQTERLPAIFSMIEELMVCGDEAVKTAVATCFLENLMNITPSKLPAHRYIPLLGAESRAYCKAWGTFTGVTTESL